MSSSCLLILLRFALGDVGASDCACESIDVSATVVSAAAAVVTEVVLLRGMTWSQHRVQRSSRDTVCVQCCPE